MSYGGYGRGYRIDYDSRGNERPGAQGYQGAPVPNIPFNMPPGGSPFFQPQTSGFPPPPQVFATPTGPVGSGRGGPPVEYSYDHRGQSYHSSSEYSESHGRDSGSSQDRNRDIHSSQSSSQKPGGQQPIDIDAILKDERLKNVLFSGISKATQKLEQSLRAKSSENPENVMFVKEQRKEHALQLFPSASTESQVKPKSILKRKGEGRPEEPVQSHPEKLSVLEKTLQLLRGKPNQSTSSEKISNVDVPRPSAALGQLSSYSDDPEDEERHLYRDRSPETNRSTGLPFWTAPSETEAAKRDMPSTFDIKEKLYEEWRNSINKKDPEKPRNEAFQLQAFLDRQLSPGAPKKSPSSGAKDNEELDSTVQNILQSIGFNFDLSKRMQELARQKKKEHDDLQTGIVDQGASFLEKASGMEDVRAKLFSGGPSNIDSLIKQARAETRNSRSSYEKFSEKSLSPEPQRRQRGRSRSSSNERTPHYYNRHADKGPPPSWSPGEEGDFRRREKGRDFREHGRSRSSDGSAATPPRGNDFSISSYRRGEPSSHGRGHHVSERFRDEPKDEYYYPDEHENVSVPPSMPLLKSYKPQMKSEDLSSGLFSRKRIPQNTEVENFTVMSRAVDDGDDSFTGSRRIILPSKTDRRVVSKSPSFRGSQSPFHKSFKRSASPLSPRPSKERRYMESREYGKSEKPKWDDPKYDMRITTFRDGSPVVDNVLYQSREYSLEAKRTRSPEKDRPVYQYEQQWGDRTGSRERDMYISPNRYKSFSPDYKYRYPSPRFKSSVGGDRSPLREWTRSSPIGHSLGRNRSPGRGRSPSPLKKRSPSPKRRRSPSPARKRSPSPGRRRLVSPGRKKSPTSKRRSPSPRRRRSPSPGRRRSPYRRSYDYKRDSYSRYNAKSYKDGKKHTPQSSSDRSKYSLDNQKKNTLDKNSTSTPGAKVDLSKMSASERKAHLNKMLAEKERESVKAKGSEAGGNQPKTKVEGKMAPSDKTSTVSETQASGSGNKTKVDVTKMTPEERKTQLAKLFPDKALEGKETETTDKLKSNLLSAIGRLSTLSVDARKQILIKMTQMTESERQEAMNNLSMRQVKVSTLKTQLEKLKREQNELMRKSQRNGLGTQDPQLIRNTEEQIKTQAEINRLSSFDPERPFAEIDMSPPPSHAAKEKIPPQKKMDKSKSGIKPDVKAKQPKPEINSKEEVKNENWKSVSDTTDDKLPDLREPSKNTSQSTSEGKKEEESGKGKGQAASSSTSSYGSSQSKTYYEYIDGGNHWCKHCHTKCNSIDQLFEHLHGKKHMTCIHHEEKPWKDSKSDKKSSQQKVGRACTRRIKGSEMLFPVAGFHCSLCKVILPDFAEASDHLKSDGHYNKYLDYIKINPTYEKKLLLERASATKKVKDTSIPESKPPLPPTEPLPPPPPTEKTSSKKRDKDNGPKLKKQLRKSGKDASSDSEDNFDFGADNTVVEDMDIDEEEDEVAIREAKSKVPKLSGKDPSWGLVAVASSAHALDNMKENKEDKDKPLGQFLSIAESPTSGSSKLPVVPSGLDLKSIPIPTGPPAVPDPLPPKDTVKSLKEIDDDEKRMMGIDVDAEEEKPLNAVPVPPPSVKAKKGQIPPSDLLAEKKPKSLDTLFAKVTSKLSSKIAAKAGAAKAAVGDVPNEMELRIQQEIKQKLDKEKMKILRQKQKEEKAKRPEEPTIKKKIYSDSSSEDSSDESEEEVKEEAGETDLGQSFELSKTILLLRAEMKSEEEVDQSETVGKVHAESMAINTHANSVQYDQKTEVTKLDNICAPELTVSQVSDKETEVSNDEQNLAEVLATNDMEEALEIKKEILQNKVAQNESEKDKEQEYMFEEGLIVLSEISEDNNEKSANLYDGNESESKETTIEQETLQGTKAAEFEDLKFTEDIVLSSSEFEIASEQPITTNSMQAVTVATKPASALENTSVNHEFPSLSNDNTEAKQTNSIQSFNAEVSKNVDSASIQPVEFAPTQPPDPQMSPAEPLLKESSELCESVTILPETTDSAAVELIAGSERKEQLSDIKNTEAVEPVSVPIAERERQPLKECTGLAKPDAVQILGTQLSEAESSTAVGYLPVSISEDAGQLFKLQNVTDVDEVKVSVPEDGRQLFERENTADVVPQAVAMTENVALLSEVEHITDEGMEPVSVSKDVQQVPEEENTANVEPKPVSILEKTGLLSEVECTIDIGSGCALNTEKMAHALEIETVLQPLSVPTSEIASTTNVESLTILSCQDNSSEEKNDLLFDANIYDTLEADAKQMTRRGRGRGKRGVSRGRGRKVLKQNSEQEFEVEQAGTATLQSSLNVPTPESVNTSQSPSKKRGRGRRGQAGKRASTKGRVTRSSLLKSEDSLEEDDFFLQSRVEAETVHEGEDFPLQSSFEAEEVQERDDFALQSAHEADQVHSGESLLQCVLETDKFDITEDIENTTKTYSTRTAVARALDGNIEASAVNLPSAVSQMTGLGEANITEVLQEAPENMIMSESQNVSPEFQETEAKFEMEIESEHDSYFAKEHEVQSQSPENESDSDATITEDVELPTACAQLDESDVVMQASPHNADELESWSNVPSSSIVLSASRDETEGREQAEDKIPALQPFGICGSPGMDPPMSGVISEIDEPVEAVTLSEEEGLLEGASIDTPSAGISLGLEDTDESMDLASDFAAMKDMEDSL
ncbi:Zinc finger protein 318 [Plakobranchus ocellatus]|uniref:Zinc finger protein 318 n=1 Tax=Plakobranchus ocellatus TaxID=259542 RepID=A0AAV3YQQ9_9GAST|nr:Zinc finger protein 318 [Plakobranchus ocellatus]